MAKLEELSELLVSEIEQFEKTVDKLQKIQKQKIGVDARAFELLFKQHYEKMEDLFKDQSMKMKNLAESLEKAKAYPVWALTTFTASLLANGILIYILISNF